MPGAPIQKHVYKAQAKNPMPKEKMQENKDTYEVKTKA